MKRIVTGAIVAALAVSAQAHQALAQDAADLRALSLNVTPGRNERAAPACPAGKKFLLTHVQAAPVVGGRGGADPVAFREARWAVRVPVQNADDGDPATPPDGATLVAVSAGLKQAETAIPSGQRLGPDETKLMFTIDVIDPTIASAPGEPGPRFNVHFSGFCGVRG